MKTNTENPDAFESTYALIVRSGERERSVSENAVFVIFMLSILFSIWQAAQQPIRLPVDGIIHSTSITQSVGTSNARS